MKKLRFAVTLSLLASLVTSASIFAAPPTAGSLEMLSLQKAARGDLTQAYELAKVQLNDGKAYFAKNPNSSQELKFSNQKFQMVTKMVYGHPTVYVKITNEDANAAVVRDSYFQLQLLNPSASKIHDTTKFTCSTNVDKNIGVETGGADYGKPSRLFADVVACTNGGD